MKKLFWLVCLLCCNLSVIADEPASQDVLAVISLNDFHGAFLKNKSQKIPGASNLIYCIDSLCKAYPAHIVVSAGDNFGGSYFSSITKGQLLPELFSALSITRSAVGNHEFDYGLAYLKDRWKGCGIEGWNITYVAANLVEKATNKSPEWCQPVDTVHVHLPQAARTITVALTGLSPETTPAQTATDLSDFTFDGDYVGRVNALASNSILAQADVKLLLTHIGTVVNARTGEIEWFVKGRSDEQIPQLLPTYCGMLSGHSHSVVCGRIEDMPVVQGGISGMYVSLLKISIVDGKVTNVQPEVVKVPFKSELPEYPIEKTIQKVSLEHHLNDVYVKADADFIHDRKDRLKMTALGSNVCASYATAYHGGQKCPVVGLAHFGGIRASLYKGDVRKIDAAEVQPFSARLVYSIVSGRSLRSLLEAGLNNTAYGYLQANNLEIRCDTVRGRMQVREMFYIQDNNRKIKVNDIEPYVVVTDPYIASGHDGYPSFLFGSTISTGQNATDVFLGYLKAIGDRGQTLSAGSDQVHLSTIVVEPSKTSDADLFEVRAGGVENMAYLNLKFLQAAAPRITDFGYLYKLNSRLLSEAPEYCRTLNRLMKFPENDTMRRIESLVGELCDKMPSTLDSVSVAAAKRKCVALMDSARVYSPYDLPLSLYAGTTLITLSQYPGGEGDPRAYMKELRDYLKKLLPQWLKDAPDARLSKVSTEVQVRPVELAPGIAIYEYWYVDEFGQKHIYNKRGVNKSAYEVCEQALDNYRNRIKEEETERVRTSLPYRTITDLDEFLTPGISAQPI